MKPLLPSHIIWPDDQFCDCGRLVRDAMNHATGEKIGDSTVRLTGTCECGYQFVSDVRITF